MKEFKIIHVDSFWQEKLTYNALHKGKHYLLHIVLGMPKCQSSLFYHWLYTITCMLSFAHHLRSLWLWLESCSCCLNGIGCVSPTIDRNIFWVPLFLGTFVLNRSRELLAFPKRFGWNYTLKCLWETPMIPTTIADLSEIGASDFISQLKNLLLTVMCCFLVWLKFLLEIGWVFKFR